MTNTTTKAPKTHYVRLDSPLPGREPKYEGPMTESMAEITASAYQKSSPWITTVVPAAEAVAALRNGR